MTLPIQDRSTAGRQLAQALAPTIPGKEALILALPRGGVPVGREIADRLGIPLDILLVRKLGAPGQRELAIGAIASGGVRVLNQDIVRSLHLSDDEIEELARVEQRELERREQVYLGDRRRREVTGKTIILVDDGVATGATMRAAIQALRLQKPARIIVALPLAPRDTVTMLAREADDVVCLYHPEPFIAIGCWYKDFTQVTDEEVRDLLKDVD
ncbi:MAG TPA: phosphoribosyltransferase [Porticoccaceae bacterium]|nr:phosphoribosyltransferase [Porticoccaceae bacterium]